MGGSGCQCSIGQNSASKDAEMEEAQPAWEKKGIWTAVFVCAGGGGSDTEQARKGWIPSTDANEREENLT